MIWYDEALRENEKLFLTEKAIAETCIHLHTYACI